jgi:hypothetical protein
MRFTIRDLLSLTFVMALMFGWWAHYAAYSVRTFSAEAQRKETWHDLDVARYRAEYWQQKYETAAKGPQGDQPSEWGDLQLRFVYDGEPPKSNTVAARTKDCAKFTLVDETWQVDPKSKGVANVALYLDSTRSMAAIHPDLLKAESEEVAIVAKECRFEPHVAILRIGQTLVLKNEDRFGHNFHCPLAKNKSFNDLLPPGESIQKKPAALDRVEERPAPLNCGIHPHMQGHLFVVNHPYAAVSDRKGKLTIPEAARGQTCLFRLARTGKVARRKAPRREGLANRDGSPARAGDSTRV